MKPKKSLGQNFLNSPSAVKAIVSAGQVEKTDVVLEIGPGKGVLTNELLKTGAKVIAIEKDDRLIIFLSELFKNEIKTGQFVLIHGDVLDLVFMGGMSINLSQLLGQKYKLIANIPYYITGEIIKRFNTTPQNPSCMVLLVQKEVAERIIANDGKESMLSVSVKMYGIPKLVKIVPRGSFNPSPNVDSAILSIQNISHFGTLKSEKEFFGILHAAFAHKRKLMLSNIKILPAVFYSKVLAVITENNLIKTRAEDVPIALWKKMIQ